MTTRIIICHTHDNDVAVLGEVDITKNIIFSGGEVHVNLDATQLSALRALHRAMDKTQNIAFCIIKTIESSDDTVILEQIVSILRTLIPNVKIELTIPYLPYARQDRVCTAGDSFALKVFADRINSLKLDKTISMDLHSTVAGKLINNLYEVEQFAVFNKLHGHIVNTNTVFISPDKGASAKTALLADWFEQPMLQFEKTRDPVTGNLSGFKLTDESVELLRALKIKKPEFLVVDDICDGGGTFIGLQKALSAQICEQTSIEDYALNLYVTHGIFSKGIEELMFWYNNIYTTDTRSEVEEYKLRPDFHVKSIYNKEVL